MTSKKVHFAVLLVVFFVVSFLAVHLAIFLTQSAYATPPSGLLNVDGVKIAVGPPPNSVNISVDTTITVDAVASAALDDLLLVPETPIARVYSESTGPLTYLNIFYPARLLESGTLYTVSVTIVGEKVTWSFTTTTEPFDSNLSFYLATRALWISLLAATAATAVAGLVLKHKEIRKRT